MKWTLVLLVGSAFSIGVQGSDWIYSCPEKVPSQWYQTYPDCGGCAQSPIDIDGSVYDDAVVSSVPLQFNDISDMAGHTSTLTFNGHSAQVDLTNCSATVTGGLMEDTYSLVQFHFHWGSDSHQGSEHLIGGKQYAAEMHLVHYNTQFKSFDDAESQENGLAVLGVLFEEGDKDNDNFKVITDSLSALKTVGDSIKLGPFPIAQLLNSNSTKYYQYRGSLTTPPCYESVIWCVYSEPMKLSADQLETFRKLPIVDNFRPVQPVNDRILYQSWED